MPRLTFRPLALSLALVASSLLWTGIGYAAGIHPVHLGLRHDVHRLAVHARDGLNRATREL